MRKASVSFAERQARLLYDPKPFRMLIQRPGFRVVARQAADDRPIGGVLIEGPLADIARRAPGGFCAASTSFGSAVTEECWFSNYFSVSLQSIVEKCKISIAFATSLGSDEICRLSW